MKSLTIFYILIILTANSYGQDSLKIDSKFDVEVRGKHILSAIAKNFDCFNCRYSKVEDNPFNHFSIYTAVENTLTLNDRFVLETGLFLEERSYSGGNNTIKNIVLFPKIKISALDTVKILNQNFNYKIKGGDFWNEDVNDILRFYNLDYHGLDLGVGYKNFGIGLLVIGDLSYNVGYDLHELYKFYFQHHGENLTNTLSLSINKLSTEYSSHRPKQDINLAHHLSWVSDQDYRMQIQTEMRINEELGTGVAFGFKLEKEYQNIKMKTALKYYQAEFNSGYVSNKPRYRSENSYVGDQLYPLKNYFRDYSQWGSYTQLQEKNLIGFELGMSINQPIFKKINFYADFDINIIGDPVSAKGYTMPLYDVGLKMNYLEVLNSTFSITNKHMNLNSFYQTVQGSKRPFLSYSVHLDLNDI